ncbi:MAG TPA: hypothetical protein VNI60_02360 [Pyrinomonadaceae bacterium]|nr:hypothetical protein [Pyrinomonadaceae bacterium]
MLARFLLTLLVSIACLFYLYGFPKRVSNQSANVPLESSPTAESSQTDCKPCKPPPSGENNKSPDVTDLTLSQTEVAAPCPSEQVPREGVGCSDKMNAQVTTTAVDPEKDVIMYHYTVSGGRIVGQGKKVFWDLTGIAPGTYTITAGVDDGCGICGQTQTRTITVKNCDCVVSVTPVE